MYAGESEAKTEFSLDTVTEAFKEHSFTYSLHYQMSMDRYKLELDKFQRYETLVRDASLFLASLVHPAIRGTVWIFEKPKEVFEWIASQYKMLDSPACEGAYTNMEELHRSNGIGVQEYQRSRDVPPRHPRCGRGVQ